jgi:steroid delta-isomerase-like uncharacterized protein
MVAVEPNARIASNEALVRRYYDVLNAYTADQAASRLPELLTQDFVFHTPNNVEGYLGRDRHLEWLAWHHGTVSEQHFIIDDIVTNDSTAATRWTLSGRHTGAFLGCPPSGRAISITGQDFFRLDSSLIKEMWRSMDLREVVRQFSDSA